MALQITLPDNYGNGGVSYWKIIESNINWLTKNSHIVMAGYVDKQARDDLRQPLDFRSYDWANDEFPFDVLALSEEGHNTLTIAYEKIKQPKLNDEGVDTNEFTNALDV